MKNKFPKIFIDGIELRHVRAWEYTSELSDIGPYIGDPNIIYRVNKARSRVRIDAADITIEAPIDYMEYVYDTEIHIYGPLRKAFPALFIARELKDWQLQYIRQMNTYKINQELKYFNDDTIFTTLEAFWFKTGWYAHE